MYIERVNSNRYLETILSKEWRQDLEMRNRVRQARNNFWRYKDTFCV